MKYAINYFHRTSETSKKISGAQEQNKKYPVCIYIRYKPTSKTYVYTTGVNLTADEYRDVSNPEASNKAAANARKINTAKTRIQAIANLLVPCLPSAMAYIIKNIKRDHDRDAFIDSAFNFDARKLTSVYLEQYKNAFPQAEIPELKKPFTYKTINPDFIEDFEVSLTSKPHKLEIKIPEKYKNISVKISF